MNALPCETIPSEPLYLNLLALRTSSFSVQVFLDSTLFSRAIDSLPERGMRTSSFSAAACSERTPARVLTPPYPNGFTLGF